MKTFTEFKEAVSAVRLAQLAAKGKGGAAKAKMAADGLKSSAPSTTTTTTKALPSGKGGAITKKPAAQQTSKAGAIVKAKSNKLANPGVKKVDVKVDKPRPQRPGTTRPDPKPETTTTTDKPETTTTTNNRKRKRRKFKLPQVSKLETDDSVATGSVGGVKMKNTIDS